MTQSDSSAPSKWRLVIRARIIPEPPPAAPARWHLSKGALPLILGIVVVLLGWVGIRALRTDPTSAPVATEEAPASKPPSSPPVSAPSEAAPVIGAEPLPQPAAETVASPSPVNEVIPDVPRSASETIRGTIIVSIRVIVGKDGTVLDATADDPGPSRYFERLSIAAAKKWTFTPADSQAERTVLVRFYFKRAGTTARAGPLE